MSVSTYTITLRIEATHAQALKTLADVEDLSLNQYIAKVIDKHLTDLYRAEIDKGFEP